MGNYLTKIRSSINLNYFTSKFEQNRGKKRKHNFLNSTELSENNEFPEDDEVDEEDEEIEEEDDDDMEDENDFIAPNVAASTSNSIAARSHSSATSTSTSTTTNYRNIFSRNNASLPTSSNRITNTNSLRLRNRRRRTEVAKLMRNSSLIQSPSSSSMLSLTGTGGGGGLSGSSTSNNLISSKLSTSSNKLSSIDAKLMTPARKKMKSTTQYVYNTLFLNGENSDLIIKALNKEWHLHKIYLCQSPYFDSMFKNGSKWKESNQKVIEIAIPDKNISEKSLFTAFGSFYKEDIEIVPLEVTSVLACASLFSLDGLLAQCETVMIENINHKSVFSYYEASIMYGIKSVTEAALKWLCYNIMQNNEICLSDIKPQLFEKIISSSDLMIVQVETDLYTLCKKWLYFQLNKSVKTLDGNWQKTCNEFFKSLPNLNITESDESEITQDSPSTSSDTNNDATVSIKTTKNEQQKDLCLLEIPAFHKYINIFKQIRIQHILTDMGSLNLLYSDRIIPHNWIEPYYCRNWLNFIYIDQDVMSHEFELSKSQFDIECARFGRLLHTNETATWRWVYFLFKF
jgi:hypothetical protein